MNSFIITLLVLCVAYTVQSVRYNGEESFDYDYEYSEYRANKRLIQPPEDLMKPTYNIKDAPQLFENFVKTYNKIYKNDADKTYHYQIFVKNLEDIIEINKYSKTQSADINQFADLDQSQLGSFLG